jgi:pimeloyl-ACP methyl ester carboxylesterase
MGGYFPFWKDIAEFLVARDYAVLLFDEPGVHESTGDWRRQSFDDRAEEVIAAVLQLAARDDIDPSRIGLIGHSQGGWIAQIAAARHPEEIAFLILLAGPAVSVKQQIRDDAENNWTCRGVSDDTEPSLEVCAHPRVRVVDP